MRLTKHIQLFSGAGVTRSLAQTGGAVLVDGLAHMMSVTGGGGPVTLSWQQRPECDEKFSLDV